MTSTNGQGHTSGPWKWHPRSISAEHNGSVYREPIQGHAYAVAMQPRYVSDEEWAANARLIAAAPDYVEAAALAITALAFEQEKALRAGDQLAYAQITQAKEALIAADNKRLGREPEMRDVTPARAALSRVSGEGR